MCSMLWTKTQFISLGGYTTNAVKEKENKLKKHTKKTHLHSSLESLANRNIKKTKTTTPPKEQKQKTKTKQRQTKKQKQKKKGEAVGQPDVNTVAWKA